MVFLCPNNHLQLRSQSRYTAVISCDLRHIAVGEVMMLLDDQQYCLYTPVNLDTDLLQ